MPASDVRQSPSPPFSSPMVDSDGRLTPMWTAFLQGFYEKTVADMQSAIAQLEANVQTIEETVLELQNEVRRNGISASNTIPSSIIEQTSTGTDILVTMLPHRRRYDDGHEVTVNETSLNEAYSTDVAFYYDDPQRQGGDVALQKTTDFKVARANYVPGRHFVAAITTMASTASGDAGKTPGTITGVGWTAPDNAKIKDEVYASQAIATVTAGTDLISSNYGFSIPSGATINGIEVTVRRYGSVLGLVDDTVRIRKAGVSIGTDLKATGIAWPVANTDRIYGGPTELWGTTWTPANINATDFGVLIRATNPTAGAATAYVDIVSVKVYYGEATTGDTEVIDNSGVPPPGWPTNKQYNII